METKEIVKELKSLCQLDIDAVHAYNQAIEHIDVVEIKDQIVRFRSDHERHIVDLSDNIRALGDEPPEFSKDFKGFLLEAFTKMRGVTGTEGSLKALKGGEEMTKKQYGKAREKDFPVQIKDLIEHNYLDEERHYNYVDQAIRDKLWEKIHV